MHYSLFSGEAFKESLIAFAAREFGKFVEPVAEKLNFKVWAKTTSSSNAVAVVPIPSQKAGVKSRAFFLQFNSA